MEPFGMFERFPQLETTHVLLRALTLNDAGDLLQIYADSEVTRYLGQRPYRSIEDARALIREAGASYHTGVSIDWGLVDRQANRVIGKCRLYGWGMERRQAELGYTLARAYWGRGLMAEAVAAVITFGFETMQLQQLEARTYLANRRSVRLLERFGFKPKGAWSATVAVHDQPGDPLWQFCLQAASWKALCSPGTFAPNATAKRLMISQRHMAAFQKYCERTIM